MAEEDAARAARLGIWQLDQCSRGGAKGGGDEGISEVNGIKLMARVLKGISPNDMKGLVDLMVAGMSHHGFAFLNVMSPCVTWRGDDQFKVMKAKLRSLPEGYDRRSRAAASAYTRETEALTTGVLYEAHEPSLLDRLEAQRTKAMEGYEGLTTERVLKVFNPPF